MHKLLCLGFIGALLLPAADNRKIGEPGKFDYYLMSLSWSPAYCATAGGGRGDPQCATGRNFAFVLHGLWPQYSRNTNGSMWPQFCTNDAGPRDTKSMLDLMPSPKLIAHEWAKHGTCSGLGAQGYFDTARNAYHSVKTPPQFANLKTTLNISPAVVKTEFLKANPALKPEAIAISCSSNYLSEVRICLDKKLNPVPCVGERECRAAKVRMPPVR